MAVKLSLIGVALAATAFVPANAGDAAPPLGLDVRVFKVKTECFADVVRATGVVVPRAKAVVMFNTPGFLITEISKQSGDLVKAGEEVAVAMPTSMAPSTPNQTDAERREVTAKRVMIKSPAPGVVLRRPTESGETPRGPLLILAVDGEMEVAIDVPNIRAIELSSGQSVRLATEDGREFSGHVRLAPAEIDRETQLAQARISIDSGPSLRPGLLVHAAIDIGRSCGPGVPLTAVRHDDDGGTVQMVVDGTIETRKIKLGFASESDTEVKQGLVDGDVVAADGDLSLRNGDKVHPVDAGSRDGR